MPKKYKLCSTIHSTGMNNFGNRAFFKNDQNTTIFHYKKMKNLSIKWKFLLHSWFPSYKMLNTFFIQPKKFGYHLGNICWLVKNFQTSRKCLHKTSNLIFSVRTKTLTDSSWEVHISFRISCIFWKQSLTDVGQTGKTSFNSSKQPQHCTHVFCPQTTQ